MNALMLNAETSDGWIKCPHYIQNDIVEVTFFEHRQARQMAMYRAHTALFNSKNQEPDMWRDDERDACAALYVGYVLREAKRMGKNGRRVVPLCNEKISFSNYTGVSSEGVADVVLDNGITLQIICFSYEKSRQLAVEHNVRMRCMALAGLQRCAAPPVRNIVLAIVQPRARYIDRRRCDSEDLVDWAKAVLRPAAQLAVAGKGPRKAGEHCSSCKERGACETYILAKAEKQRIERIIGVALSDEEMDYLVFNTDAWSQIFTKYEDVR